MKFSRIAVLSAVSMLFAASGAVADQVTLTNGDTLSGKIVKKETDKLIFKTEYAGEIKLDWAQVASLKSDEPVKVILADDTRIKGDLKPSAKAEKQAVVVSSHGETPVQLSDVSYINPPAYIDGTSMVWNGFLNAGGADTWGNTSTRSFYVNGEAVGRTQNDRLTVGGMYNKASASGTSVANNGRLYTQYDRFINKQWFMYGNASLERDVFRDLQLQTMIGAGAGYQVYDTPMLKLAVEAGAGYVWQNFNSADDKSFPMARWGLRYDQDVYNGIHLFHNHQILFGLTNLKDTIINTQTGVRIPVVNNINAGLQLNYNWFGNPPASRKKGDGALLFTLGYHW